MRQIYLDYNATTPVAPSVLEAMLPFFKQHYGNPSSGHAFGRACNEAIEDARSQVAALLGATSEEIVFTSGGTESNNLALKGVDVRRGGDARRGCVGEIQADAGEQRLTRRGR
ncbi:MAG: aminotransferase class V-fold PLP-dependent enzyme [Planctomycetales bacterium]|nr:aminotransferase class V-fold PLP-dependent enzyme [Planctomycetales bacterium]